MDENTKNIYSALKAGKEMEIVLSVLSDVFTNSITEKTLDKTVEIRNISSEYWDNNRWLNMLGNGDIESKDFNSFIRNEIEFEFLEDKQEQDDRKEIGDFPIERRLWEVVLKEEKEKEKKGKV